MSGRLLTEWNATAREAQAVIDGLRLFVTEWNDDRTPIELPLVLILLLNAVRGEEVVVKLDEPTITRVQFAVPPDRDAMNARPESISAKQLFPTYHLAMANSLPQLLGNNFKSGAGAYMTDLMINEFQLRFGGITQNRANPPMPSWSQYIERVRGIGSFLKDVN